MWAERSRIRCRRTGGSGTSRGPRSRPARRRRRPPAAARCASWCSGTGPAGCTTTCGSRSTACWSAGRCRTGPTLDPKARRDGGPRRGPPDRVPRLRGRHPGRRVRRRGRHRLGHRHLGAARRPTTRSAAVARRRAARRGARAEAARPAGAGPPGPRAAAARSSGCCCTSGTSTRWTAGTPRTTRGRCSVDGPTTRSRPTRTGCGGRTCRPPRRPSRCDRRPCRRRPTTSWPRWTSSAAAAPGRSSAASCG